MQEESLHSVNHDKNFIISYHTKLLECSHKCIYIYKYYIYITYEYALKLNDEISVC